MPFRKLGAAVVRLLPHFLKTKSTRMSAGEQHFRHVVEDAIQGVIVHRDWKILYANAAAAKMFGYANVEDLMKIGTIDNVIAPHEHERVAEMNRVHPGGEAISPLYEVECVCKDGSTILLETMNSVIEWNGKRALQSAAIDITARRESEDALRVSAERYVDATRIAKLGHWVFDLEQDRMTYCSDELARIHRVSVSEYLEMTSSTEGDIARVHPEDRETYAKSFRNKDDVPPTFDLEYRAILPDGTIRHLREIGEPVWEADGTCRQTRGTLQDITEQKDRERALKESEERFRNAERIAKLFHWQTGRQFEEWVYASDNAAEIYGVPIDEITGPFENYAPFILEEDIPTVEEAYRSFNEDPRAYELEYRIIHKNGEIRWMREVGEPFTSASGEMQFFHGTTQDITQVKEIERELLLARVEAERANSAKSDFLANMSHELRTPLNSIIGFTDLMRNGIYGEIENTRYVDYLKDIDYSAQHLLNLISDILDISKIEAGQLQIERAPVDLVSVLQATVDLVRPQSDAKKHKISLNVPDAPVMIGGDERVLRQIAINLISNAVKFTPENGEIRVEIDQPNETGTTVRFQDTGIGIAKKDISRALAPFSQIGADATRAREGTGLGLYLARKWTALHGATLKIDSHLGEGTTVSLTFPKDTLMTDFN